MSPLPGLPPGRAMCLVGRNQRKGVHGLGLVTGDCTLKKWGIKNSRAQAGAMSHGMEATSYLQQPLVSIPPPPIPCSLARLSVTLCPHSKVPPALLPHGPFQGSSLALGVGGGVRAGLGRGRGRELKECNPHPSTQ